MEENFFFDLLTNSFFETNLRFLLFLKLKIDWFLIKSYFDKRLNFLKLIFEKHNEKPDENLNKFSLSHF